jgi:hypothetical protein
MSKEIKSLSELRREIALLEARQADQEEKLQIRLKKLTEDLKPVNLIRNAYQSYSRDSGLNSQLVVKGAEAAIGFLVSNILFKNFGPAARTIASVVGSSVASGILGDQAEKYIGKFKNLIQKFKESRAAHKDMMDEKDISGQ